MHTVELLEHALEAARRLGFRVRHEWLGLQGGACEIKGQRWLFLDHGQDPAEQLGVVLDALRGDPRSAQLELPAELSQRLGLRKSA